MSSIWNIRYHLAIFTLSLFSVYVFWQIQKIDLLSSGAVIELVSDLQRTNNMLNEEMLETRYFRRDNYNHLTKIASDISELPNRMKRSNIQRFLQSKITFQQNFIQLENIIQSKVQSIENFKSAHAGLYHSLETFPEKVHKQLQKNTSPDKSNELYFLLLQSFVHGFTNSESTKAHIEKITAYINQNQNQNQSIAIILKKLNQQRLELDKMIAKILQIPITKNIDYFFELYKKYHKEQLNLFSYYKRVLTIIVILLLITLSLLLYNWLAKTRVVEPLNKISLDLYHAVANLSDASNKIKKTSEWLTNNGKQQNSAIQNTNILLHEMTQTAQTHWLECNKAKEITETTNAAIRDSVNHSHKMILAIKEMEAASYEASTILQNIQEIAKQSKIVGLNATIEAAKSDNEVFGLVAQEVSSLAIRSAEALEETSSQILNSQERSRQGTNLTENILLYLSDMNFKIQNLEQKIDKMDDYFKKQKNSFEMFGNTVGLIATSMKKNEEFSEENAQLAENLHHLSRKLKDNVTKMLTLNKELAANK
ncbi:DAHL domain-containing protein [Candidatus Uabimicrobium sp. HlEnr_7]|uniref:DAHL domain-containing protein n=1 Tax=Candidatus Uabimicrobium helgolandensis TaxID=3095367 RepID=UPI0035578F3B